MLKCVKYFIFITLLWIFIDTNAWYNYPYVCNNQNCYITEFWELSKKQDGYFLSNEKFLEVENFKNYINTQLQNYSNYYGNTKITIDWYYSWTGWVTDKQFTFKELLNANWFYITEMQWFPGFKQPVIVDSYNSWKDYLFSNFTEVINDFHRSFPSGDKKNQLKNILSTIVYYDNSNGNFAIKNVCESEKCYKSNYLFVNPQSTNSYKFILWTIKKNSEFMFENFKVSQDFYISKTFLKWWESLNFNFKFEDYLDASKGLTQYNYRIYYRYEGEGPKEFLNETIFVSKDYKISSPNIAADIINNIIDIDILNADTKKIRIWVKEWITLTKVGKITFYFSVENVTTEEKFDLSIINYSPVEVIPTDDVKTGKADITTPFSKALNNIWFNVWDTFSVGLSIKDAFWNEHYDYADGYEISLESWTSQYIELSKAGSSEYSKVLSWVKTTSTSPYRIEFKFRITKSGYHVFNWFNVKVRSKQNNSSYITPAVYYDVKAIIPGQLYDGNQKMNIFIKSSEVSDFTISCSKWPIILRTTCTSDNFSGCNSLQNQSLVFNNESQNGAKGYLSIVDYAHNVKRYQYVMDHVDTTPPVITFKKWSQTLSSTTYNSYASDTFSVTITEQTTPTCVPKANTTYALKINGKTVKSWTTKDIPFIISLDELKVIWAKEVTVEAIDAYGNASTQTITFNIFPSNEHIQQKTTITQASWERYADNSQYYEYTLTLQDTFWNPVYNKNIELIDQSCFWIVQCKTIQTDMTSISFWTDALIEYDFTNNKKTNNQGQITFKLKSLAPWEFTERFKIILSDWGPDYNPLSTNIEFHKDTTFNKIFLKPFYWTLLASKDRVNYNILPEIWTELSYKLNVTWVSSLSSTQINLTDFKEYIKPIDNVNTLIQNLSNINGLNTKTPTFTARMNTSSGASKLAEPGIKISDIAWETPIIISYTLWWQKVQYYLSADNLPSSREVISIENIKESFAWVRVIWGIQWAGKSEFTWQQANISDLYNSDQRVQIRKNAYEYVKNMKNNTIINGVKYSNGNITIPDADFWKYETLVVINGNVTINQNINAFSNNKLFWVVVLKDNYDINKDYNTFWNIYITPDVSVIHAIMYADGGMISVNNAWTPYLTDSAIRTAALNKQLYLKGSIFTRNTIGWAILWWKSWWNYILPWWAKTTQFDSAMLYDLNYVRRWNSWCDKNANGFCNDSGEFRDYFVIEYDSRVQIAPPKIFVK